MRPCGCYSQVMRELTQITRPANDNLEKLPNSGWWIVPVFILSVLVVLAISAFRAYGGETVEVKYREWPVPINSDRIAAAHQLCSASSREKKGTWLCTVGDNEKQAGYSCSQNRGIR